MKIAVVEDNVEDRTLLVSYIKKFSYELNCEVEVIAHSLGENFLEDEDLSLIDSVFLDIFMGIKNGMDVAKAMRDQGYKGFIIFCTTTADFALEGYSVNAMGYIVKPFTYEAIKTLLVTISKILRENTRYIRVKDGRQWCKINLLDVLYVEKQGNYVRIHTPEKTYSMRMALSEMGEQLFQYNCFVKCDRGIIVNLDNIREIQEYTILLKNNERIPISRSSKPVVNNRYFDFIFEQME